MNYILDDKVKELFIKKGFTESMIGKKLGIPTSTVESICCRLGLYETYR